MLAAAWSAPAAADTLTVAGATTFNTAVMVPHQAAIERATGHKLVVIPNKTDLGVELLLERRVDLAMISTSLDAVARSVKKSNPGAAVADLIGFEVYRARVVFTVHPSNTVRSISAGNLRNVLLGKTTNWKELGGRDLPIRIVMVDGGAGIPLAVQTQLLEGKPIAADNAIRVRISSQTAKVVEQEPGALGLTQARNVPGHNIVALTTDGTVEQVLSYVSLGQPSAAVKSVIEATQTILDATQ